jgi:alpha-tubulin suppressor-like RCC1 family protein
VCPVGFAGGKRGVACRPRVAAGAGHTCALLANGTVKCWGVDNSSGQLGDNTQMAHAVPAAVTGLTNVAALDAGRDTTCAILGDGTVKCWGANGDGQIGDNTKSNRLIPVAVTGLTDVIALDTAFGHTCVARRDGSVRCWGNNSDGQLGASNVGGSVLTPQGIAGVTGAHGVATGNTQSCAILKANGTAQCWGSGLLGDGAVSSSYTPVTVKNLPNIAEIVFGGFHACARQASTTVYCWGTAALLGTGSSTTDGNPAFVPSVGSVSIGIGVYSTVVVQGSGGLTYWGAGSTPATMAGLSNVVAISHHGPNICAVHRNGTVSCWSIANSTITAPVVVSGLNVF